MPALIPKTEGDSAGKGDRKPKREKSPEEKHEKQKSPKSRIQTPHTTKEQVIMPQFVLPTLPDYTKEIAELKREIDELKAKFTTDAPISMDKNMAEFTRLALHIAHKYAQTKKRWFLAGKPDPKLQNIGLDPNNKERDKQDFERLLQISKLMNI